MEQILPKSEFVQDYNRCRACLKFTEDTIFILNTPSVFNESLSYWDILLSICTIEKVNNVEIPQEICATCARTVEACYEFKLLCETSDKILQSELKPDRKEIVGEENFKIEITDEKINWGIDSIKTDPTDLENASNEDALDTKINTVNDLTVNIKDIDNEDSPPSNHNTNTLQQEGHSCKTCGRTFASKANLKKHLQKFPMNCPHCEYKALCRPDYKRHFRTHSKKTSTYFRPCNYCGLIFNDSKELQQHLTQFHSDKKFGCEFCTFICYSPRNFVLHMKQKHPDEKFRCNFCNFDTNMHRLYTRHVYTEHSEIFQPKQCEFCDYSNVCGATLSRHMMDTHADKRPFECPKCKIKFFNEIARNVHIRTHHVNDPISCKICGKHFRAVQTLKNHQSTHITNSNIEIIENLDVPEGYEEKKLKCDQCGKLFKGEKGLSQHVLSVHENAKQHECTVCKKKFSWKESLKNHMTTHTGIKSYECDMCGKLFATRAHLKRHEVVHSKEKQHLCKFCGRSYNVASNLKRHLKTCHESSESAF